MARVAYGTNAYIRTNGNFPPLECENLYVEQTPAADQGVALLSRKGLSAHSTLGNGKTRGVFCKEGVFSQAIFAVAGNKVYKGTDSLGSIAGGGPVSFAASASELAITAGASIYRYDGTSLDLVGFPDSANVRSINFMAGYFLAARDGGHKFYYSAVLDADSWDALDFASAESSPDTLLEIGTVGDYLWLFGGSSTEVWQTSGDSDLPFTRIPGRVFPKGIWGTGCAAELDNTIFWVGSDCSVYRGQDGAPQRVSHHGIEEVIASSATCSAFSFSYEGHIFFAVRLDSGVYLYDAATQCWCKFTSYQRATWRVSCATMNGRTPIFGDDGTGKLWTFDGWSDGGRPVVRQFTAAFAINGGTVSVARIEIEANTGYTGVLVGQGTDPLVEMQSSRSAGATWNDWRAVNMGIQGQYRARPQWRPKCMFDAPGAMFRFRYSEPTPFRMSGVYVNERAGGRSR